MLNVDKDPENWKSERQLLSLGFNADVTFRYMRSCNSYIDLQMEILSAATTQL